MTSCQIKDLVVHNHETYPLDHSPSIKWFSVGLSYISGGGGTWVKGNDLTVYMWMTCETKKVTDRRVLEDFVSSLFYLILFLLVISFFHLFPFIYLLLPQALRIRYTHLHEYYSAFAKAMLYNFCEQLQTVSIKEGNTPNNIFKIKTGIRFHCSSIQCHCVDMTLGSQDHRTLSNILLPSTAVSFYI